MHQIGTTPKKRRKKNLQKNPKTTEEEGTEAIEVIETMNRKKTMDSVEIEEGEETETLTVMDFLPETMITEDLTEMEEEADLEVVADSTEVIVNKEVALTEAIVKKEALTEEIVKKVALTEAIVKKVALTEAIVKKVALTEAIVKKEGLTGTATTKISHLQEDKAGVSIETLKTTMKILEGVKISTTATNRAIPTAQMLRFNLQSTKPTWSSSQRDSNHGQK
jgi:tRNA U34 5-methylaminomethyl-2-thiouridine-forming methyltransferase MnmC